LKSHKYLKNFFSSYCGSLSKYCYSSLALLGLRQISLGLLLLPLPTLDIKLLHLGIELFDFLILVIALRLGLLSHQLIAHVFVHLHALIVFGVGIDEL
jgi:hypothetical protein